ncbi:MAG: PA14 domain-containing protein [Sedimentisphaerales bacterium]|nr:PA14 domain-containing protein [Sedimentisphaerales bacterium]
MSKKLIFLVSFIFVLSVVLTGIAKADLVGWWRFDESSGTIAADSSGNGNNGTVMGGAEWVDGQLGGALLFNGQDSYVAAPHIPFDSRSFTIMMWVNPVLYTSEQVIFGQVESSTQNLSMHYRLYGPDSGRVRMGFYSNDLDTTTTIEQNNWYHLTFWYDFENQSRRIYINGILEAEADATPYLGSSGETRIGQWNNNQWFQGIIDDVQIYDHPLSENDIQAAMRGLEGYPYASNPSPKDDTLHLDTWISLGWKAGDFAVSHDVYFGDNFEDVNSGAESVFQGNQADTFYVAGFPGFAYPDGLVPGTTYYWRVDEVNDSEPNSPWKGRIWNFFIPPRNAYDPVPYDGAIFIDPETELSFTPGFGSKLHTIYFGDNFDDVNDAAGGAPGALTTFDPGTLELRKTYYWRVDEFDAMTTNKGNVWSFKTAGEGVGVKAEYFSGMDLRTPVLTQIDPQIDFDWASGEPDPAIGTDNFSVRWTGEVEAGYTETYTFYTNSDDGVRLWIDGQQLVNNWTDHAAVENSGTIDLVEGNTYSLVMEFYENGGSAVAQLRWSSPSTPKDFVPQAALSLPVKAGQANPANGAVDTRQTLILTWSPGEAAVSHEVYFAADADAVRNADTSSPEYKGSRQLGSESYDTGQLEWNTTYYWRIDEIEDDGTIQTGNLWSFTTADFLIVDDMELYNDINEGEPGSNRIYLAWVDGFDNPSTNGSVVGNLNAPFAEQTIVHSGIQSMPMSYDNAVGKSEATLTLTSDKDWTVNGVTTLAIWFRGASGNVAESLYVALNGGTPVTNDDPDAATTTAWTEWNIDLQAFGVNLSNVNTITLGLSSISGGTGIMYFDDIRLYAP